MNRFLVSLLLFSLTHQSFCQIYPSKATVDRVTTDIYNLIDATKIVAKKGPAQYPFIAGLVRLAFHDCVGNGKCDGCIDHNVADNNGLKVYTDLLDPIYNTNYKPFNTISRADFYALASLVALTNATVNLPDKFTGLSLFIGGRVDCANSPAETADDNPNFPLAGFNNSQLVTYFSQQFGFSANEVVALMGAHTLGRCHAESSGYEGPWVKGKDLNTGYTQTDLLNNVYHQQIQGNWQQVHVVETGKVQWQRLNTTANSPSTRSNDEGILLDADISLAWDINPDNNGDVTCQVSCSNSPSCCPKALSTRTQWLTYVNSNIQWLSDFTAVFLKMINMNSNAALLAPQP